MKKPKNNTDEIQFEPNKKKKRKELPYWTKWVVFVFIIISSLLTLFVIYITFLSLDEIKIQRLKSDEPIILVESEELKLFGNLYDSIGQNMSTLVFYYSYVDEIDTSDIIGNINKKWWSINPNNFYLYPKNVGNGVALDVYFNFEFDTLFFLQFINKYKHYSFNNLDTIINNNGYIILVGNNDTTYLKGYTRNTSIPFIINYDKERIPTRIKVPDTYFQLFSLFQFTKLKIGLDYDKTNPLFSNYDSFIEPPPLTLNIIYKDINIYPYSETYELTYVSGGSGSRTPEYIHFKRFGMFNVVKKTNDIDLNENK